MKSRAKFIPFIVALAILGSSCSSGSTSESTNTVKTKNVALVVENNFPDLTDSILNKESDTKNTSGTTVPRTKNNALPVADTKVQASSSSSVIIDFKERVFLPSRLCALVGLNCAVLDFASVKVSSPTAFVATAQIPMTTIKLPAGDGYGFAIKSTALQIAGEGSEYKYSILADVDLTLGGTKVPLNLVGTYDPKEASISIEMSNNKVQLNNAMGIPGFSIQTITAKNTYVAGVPAGVGLSVSGTLPTIFKELGVKVGTPFRAAFEVGVGVTVGMSVGSRDPGAPDIISLQNVLSTSFIQASFSTVGTTIAGVEYRKGFQLIFDGKFGKTPVKVDGSIVSYAEYQIEFEVGAFSLVGFEFEETKGKIVRGLEATELGFSGGLKGYGVEGRLQGQFDPFGGIELLGEGSFKPAGVDLGKLKFSFVGDKDGVSFLGTGSQNFGVVTGTTTVGFKSFANKKLGFTMEVDGEVEIPGIPSYASIDGELSITNCPEMTCLAPTSLPTAKIAGSASFYKQPKQEFSLVVDPSNWGFRQELKFDYDKDLSYKSDGFEVGVRAWGQGSAVISNTGITFGKGSINASAEFGSPSVRVPPVTVVETKTRLYKTVCSGKGLNWGCRQKGYWNYAGGETITPGYTIPGVKVKLSASVGIDSKGFYVEVQPGKDVKGARLYFPA